MSKSKQRSDKALIATVISVSVIIGIALTAYVKFAPADRVERPEDPSEQGGRAAVKIFKPVYEDGTLIFTTEEMETPIDEDPCVYAVNEYLRGVAAIPDGAVAVACVLEGGVATLDFTKQFDRTYGTEDEMIIINGIRTVMAQFKDVEFIRILSEGMPIDTLGNLELRDPLSILDREMYESVDRVDMPAKS